VLSCSASVPSLIVHGLSKFLIDRYRELPEPSSGYQQFKRFQVSSLGPELRVAFGFDMFTGSYIHWQVGLQIHRLNSATKWENSGNSFIFDDAEGCCEKTFCSEEQTI
jgi:hypothetical protein